MSLPSEPGCGLFHVIMDWDMLQKPCRAFQVIYEPNPFEYSSLCAVTSWSHHFGLILSLSRFEETLMAPILFRAQKGHDPVCQTSPPPFPMGDVTFTVKRI